LAVLDPAATVTEEEGTGSNVLLLVIETAVPPVGAALAKEIVHVVAAPEFRVAGLHASEDRARVGAVRLTVAVCEIPLGTAAVA
jgi:hypothetical protein